MSYSRLQKRKSFTLIEMLIVIVIIGILAAALVPRLTDIQSRARNVKRKADITTLTNGIRIYYTDHADYPRSLAFLQTGNIMTTIPSDPQVSARHPCAFWTGWRGTDPLLAGGYTSSWFYDVESVYGTGAHRYYYSMAFHGYMYASCATYGNCDYAWVGAQMENDGSINSYGGVEGTWAYHACFWSNNYYEWWQWWAYGKYNAYLNIQNELAQGLDSSGKLFLRLFYRGDMLY